MSHKLKPDSCHACPLYEEDIFVPGGHTLSKVIIMSDCPPSFGGHFSGKGESLIRSIVKQLATDEQQSGTDTMMQDFCREAQYMYSMLCHTKKVTKTSQTYCRDTQVMGRIMSSNAEVILCLGKDLAMFFNLVGMKQKDLRGMCINFTLPNGKSVKVIFTIGVSLFLKQPGLYSLLKEDILRAASALRNRLTPKLNIETLRGTYDIATDLDTIKDIAREYQVYTNGKSVKNTLMALDTETNTLFPWWHEARIISFSAGFGDGKACSFLVDHREANFSLEDVLPYLLKISCSEHPKAWWNYKFDLMMFKSLFLTTEFTPGLIQDIERETGLPFETIKENDGVINTRWDPLLAEHLLKEDMKGWYSLKSRIADYKYELYGYEDAVEAEKKRIESEKLEQIDQVIAEQTLDNLDSPTNIFPPDARLKDLKDVYESLKAQLKRKKKRAKSTQNDRLMSIVTRKEESLASEWRDLKESAKKYKKEAAGSLYVKNPDRAGLPTLFTYEDLPVDLLLLYGAIDADGTGYIARKQRIELSKEEHTSEKSTISLMDRHCIPLTEVLTTIQLEGVFVCPETVKGYKERLTDEIEETVADIKEKLSTDFPFIDENKINLNSSSSVGNIILGYYGLPVLEETDTGEPSFTEPVMLRYAKEWDNEVALNINKYKKLTKARDTYVTGLESLSGYDQRIHGTIHLNGTATGRSSSSSPNLQNIPEKIRDYIIKALLIPTPIHKEWSYDGLGKDYYLNKYKWREDERLVIVDADLSGAEVKVMARFAPDQHLIKALNDGLDAHSWITSEIHGVSYEDINTKRKLDTEEGKRYDELRQGTKAVVFKILYGGEPEDQELKHLIFNRFPGIPEYLDRIKREVYENHKVYTPNGRCRRFPMVRLSDWAARRMYRQAINYGIQSYCSDIVLNMLNNIYSTLHEVRGRLLLTVHDSVVFEMPECELDNIQQYLNRNITGHIAKEFPDIPVSMPFGFKVGYSYGEMYSLKDWHKKKS